MDHTTTQLLPFPSSIAHGSAGADRGARASISWRNQTLFLRKCERPRRFFVLLLEQESTQDAFDEASCGMLPRRFEKEDVLLHEPYVPNRALKAEHLAANLVICGGGLAGTCAAITAARAGLRVVLVQDRPVLGGNASSEIRLWALGATSHMGNNNRWAREGGIIDELLVENTYRNPDGNALLFDTILLEKVIEEPNIRLLLNTAVFEVAKDSNDPDHITSVKAICSQNSTMYVLYAPLFMDASGDGVVGFLAGAAFRMGAEKAEEFGEGFAPGEEYGELLGHSIYFMSKDVGHPVQYVPPSFAHKDIEKIIPRYRDIRVDQQGCKFWWIEYGGRLDTVHNTEEIKWELWRIVYGVWDYIKNSGKFPNTQNLTLEWIGHIPGKRESRRFEGDYMLNQRDVVQQRQHLDAVSYGGWSLDLHPADGVFSEKPGCNQWHSKGVYQIPYRCLYSRNINNLFLAGRIISVSHVAFGSTRVMMTCAHNAQAAALAAAMCLKYQRLPRDIASKRYIHELQTRLLRLGQYIPGIKLNDTQDLTQDAIVSTSSAYTLDQLPADAAMRRLDKSWAMLVPVKAGRVPRFTFEVEAREATQLVFELRASSRAGNHTPDVTLATRNVTIGERTAAAAMREHTTAGRAASATASGTPADGGYVGVSTIATTHFATAPSAQTVTVDFDVQVDVPQYLFVCMKKNPAVMVRCSDMRVTGIVAVQHKMNDRVATSSTQTPPDALGVEAFEMWRPQRRPNGHNFAVAIDPPIDVFGGDNLTNGIERPTTQPNAWVADPADPKPTVTLTWDEPRTISQIVLAFDTDYDHPMESTLWGHPETVMPFCVRRYRVTDAQGHILASRDDNYQSYQRIILDQPVTTTTLRIELAHPSDHVPASLFAVRCYATQVDRVTA